MFEVGVIGTSVRLSSLSKGVFMSVLAFLGGAVVSAGIAMFITKSTSAVGFTRRLGTPMGGLVYESPLLDQLQQMGWIIFIFTGGLHKSLREANSGCVFARRRYVSIMAALWPIVVAWLSHRSISGAFFNRLNLIPQTM